jgi:hypothetical protein
MCSTCTATQNSGRTFQVRPEFCEVVEMERSDLSCQLHNISDLHYIVSFCIPVLCFKTNNIQSTGESNDSNTYQIRMYGFYLLSVIIPNLFGSNQRDGTKLAVAYARLRLGANEK